MMIGQWRGKGNRERNIKEIRRLEENRGKESGGGKEARRQGGKTI